MLNWNRATDSIVKHLMGTQKGSESARLSSSSPQTNGQPLVLNYRSGSLRIGSPEVCIAILLLVSLKTPGVRTAFFFENLERKIGQQVIRNREQGKWSIVRELLELPGTYLAPRWKTFANYSTERDFYGNWLPLLLKVWKNFTVEPMHSQRYFSWDDHSGKKGKRKAFRRGYDDKGSRRPDHKWLPKNAYAREDVSIEPILYWKYRTFELFSCYEEKTYPSATTKKTTPT